MASGGDEVEDALAQAEDEPQLQPDAAFEVIVPEPANPQPGMQMRDAKAVSHGVDHARDFAAAGLREFAHAIPEAL